MMFTKFFTVAALATTLTAGAFAMEDEGHEYTSQVSNDAAFGQAHRDHLNSLGSTSDVIAQILKSLGIPGSDFVTACNGTDINSMKTCVKKLFENDPKVKNDIKLQTAIAAGCNRAACGSSKMKDACGVLACSAYGKVAGEKGTCWVPPCSDHSGLVYNCLGKVKDACNQYMD